MRRAGNGIAPIYAQQSIREMIRTGRSPQQVMQDALAGMQAAGAEEITGADADHLKTADDVTRTVEAGFCFFTIDPSDYVDQGADDYSESQLREKVSALRQQALWFDDYCGTTRTFGNVSIEFSEAVCLRATVKYGAAIQQAIALSGVIREANRAVGRDYEIELSVDETPQPTTLAEHAIIAGECLASGMPLVSLAPRFIGELEKGVDYKGDLQILEASLDAHAAIASELGPYKLSLHSGSDKLSMYGALARATLPEAVMKPIVRRTTFRQLSTPPRRQKRFSMHGSWRKFIWNSGTMSPKVKVLQNREDKSSTAPSVRSFQARWARNLCNYSRVNKQCTPRYSPNTLPAISRLCGVASNNRRSAG